MRCAAHPNVETNLSCGKCGKPICPRCLVQTPVGARCRDCAGLKRLPTYEIPLSYYLRAVGAGIGMAVVCGIAWWVITTVLPLRFFQLFIAAGVGYAIGEVTGLAVNRKRGTGLAIIGGAAMFLSYLISEILFFPWAWSLSLRHIWGILALALGIFMAVKRLR